MTTEPSILDVKIKRWFHTKHVRIEIPARGPYEPEATKKQKHFLMKLGIEDPESIRKLGRDQASFMIDQFLELRRRKGSGLGTFVVIGLLGFFAYTLYHQPGNYQTGSSAPAAASPQPRAQRVPNSSSATPPHLQAPSQAQPSSLVASSSQSIIKNSSPVPTDGMIDLESTDGKVIRARILSETKDTLLIRRADNQEFELPLARLNAASRARVEAYRASQRAAKPQK